MQGTLPRIVLPYIVTIGMGQKQVHAYMVQLEGNIASAHELLSSNKSANA